MEDIMTLQKTAFPERYIDITCEELGMSIEEYAGITFRMWRDPSRKVVRDIMKVVNLSEDELMELSEKELQKIEDAYNFALSKMFIDSSIDGLKFDTPEDIEEAFSNPHVPDGFLHVVLVGYLTYLFEANDKVKKTVNRSQEA
jgi:hypothetical protein